MFFRSEFPNAVPNIPKHTAFVVFFRTNLTIIQVKAACDGDNMRIVGELNTNQHSCTALLCSHNTHVSLAYMREHDIEHTIHHRSSSDGTFDKDILNITHSRNYICTGVQLVFRTLLPFYKISLFHFASTMNKTNKNTNTFYSKIYSCCHVYYMDRTNRKKLTV